MPMLSSKDVVNALIRKGQPDRVALQGLPWQDTIAAWVTQGYPTRSVYKDLGEGRWRPDDGRWDEVTAVGEYEEPIPPWQHFDYDMVSAGPWMDVLPKRGYSELIEETPEWETRRNGAGAALKYWKHKSGTPEHIDFLMTSRDVWDQDYRAYLLDLDPKRINFDAMRTDLHKVQQAGKWAHYGHLFIWEIMRSSLGDVAMFENLALDPDWIHDIGRVYTDFYKCHFAYIFEQAGLPDGMWIYEDMGYKNGLFASPKMLRELIFPYYTELVAFFHSYDLPVVFHTCGSTAQALPLILEAGFDALNPMERKAKDNDPFIFAEKYGDQIAFVGGLDARVFETNDKAIIRKEITTYIEGMKARNARLIFASDHSISTNVEYESYLYGVQVYRECMLY